MNQHITDSDYYPLPGGSTMQQTFKYWIYANVRNGQVVYELSDIEWTSADCIRERVLIGEHTITHDLPETSKFTPLIVEKLETKKAVMQAPKEEAYTVRTIAQVQKERAEKNKAK